MISDLMNKEYKDLANIDLVVVQVPKYVEYECPHCEEEIEIDYNEFCDFVGEPPDWSCSRIKCPNCNKELKIDNVEWD
jgi:predicted RNA-binding Zn-ribbon protein involved in translation (DUF1610 family)